MDAISSGKVGLQAEPLVKGQDFYTAVATVLSSVVTDQTADPAALLKTAADTFQTNVLDQIK